MAFTRVNGIQIYYELHGTDKRNEPSEVVTFLHGLGSSSRDWERQVAAFADDYRVLLIDMRGHGQSDKPMGPYSMPQFASDVITLLDRLGIRHTHIVGLSMGGMVAFQMALDYPQRIGCMVIVNSGPAVVPKTLKEHFSVWMRFFIVRAMGMKKLGETLAPRLFVDADQEAERQMFIQRWAENDKRAYLNTMRAIVGWSVADKIGAINVPTLVIAADHDYTPVAAKEAYIANMPTATLKVIENAHHAVPVERPEQFNQVVREFLATS